MTIERQARNDGKKFVLPPKDNGNGAKIRVLIAECAGPSEKGYTLEEAAECMQLIDKVIWNRLRNPALYKAKGAKTVADIIKAPGQIEGFEEYPEYKAAKIKNIQDKLNIANDAKNKKNADFAAFISTAFDVLNGPPIPDPSPGTLAGWKTEGHAPPGPNFKLYKTIMGNSFYYVPKSFVKPKPEPKPELGDFTEPNLKYT